MHWAQHEPAAFEYQRLSLPSWPVIERADEQSIEADGRQGIAVPVNSAATPSYSTSATTSSGMALWSFDQLIARIWVALSTGVLIVFATASLTVVRQARLWTAAQLHGIPVRISDDVGPAVIGIVHPFIVVPHWLLSKSGAVQRATVTHELEHMRARDPAVWRLGLVLVALTPWEPHRVVAVAQAPFRDRKRL